MITINSATLSCVVAVANHNDLLQAYLLRALTADQRRQMAALCNVSDGSFDSFDEALLEIPSQFESPEDIPFLAAKVQENKDLLKQAMARVVNTMN